MRKKDRDSAVSLFSIPFKGGSKKQWKPGGDTHMRKVGMELVHHSVYRWIETMETRWGYNI